MAIIQGAVSTTQADVDGNRGIIAAIPQVNQRLGGTLATGGVPAPNFVGAVRYFTENDPGLLTGSPSLLSPRTSPDSNLQVGMMTPLFDYSFNATAQDTGSWFYAFTTMTITESGGFVTLNAGNIGTAATGCYLSSKRFIPLIGNAALRLVSVVNISLAAAANEVWYLGLGTPVSSTAAPTDGVWFQYNSSGLSGVVAFNGTLTTVTLPTPGTPQYNLAVNTNVLLEIRIADRVVSFWAGGALLGQVAVPAGQGAPFLTDALPIFMQYVNTGTVSGGSFMQLKVASVAVDQLDSNLGITYSHAQALKGLCAYQGLQGGTMGSTALYSNSLAAGAGAAMTNTTAALGTGLGGQFSWQPTLAAGTDGILCSFQNPVGSVNQTPRTLVITGVRIQSIVTTAFTGGPVLAAYSLAFGHTAVSMATAETGSFVTASTKAPRRIALGLETFVVTAAVGQVSGTNPVQVQFASPVVVNPGEFIAIVAKNLGTVTSAGVVTSLVTFDGYFE